MTEQVSIPFMFLHESMVPFDIGIQVVLQTGNEAWPTAPAHAVCSHNLQDVLSCSDGMMPTESSWG